jgi:hypothetical protein
MNVGSAHLLFHHSSNIQVCEIIISQMDKPGEVGLFKEPSIFLSFTNHNMLGESTQ